MAPTRSRAVGLGALLGLVVGGVAVGVAQLVAGITNADASPVVAVGESAIDLAPEWLKSWAIATFGAADKAVLLGGIAVVLAVAAIALGVAAVRRPAVGAAGLVGFGAIGALAVLGRPDGTATDLLPTVAGALAGMGALAVLHRRLPEPSPPTPYAVAGVPGSIDRRRFLLAGAAGAVGAVLAGGIGSVLARRSRAQASRADVRIPAPSDAATTVSGVDPSVPGISPFFTPNEEFYRVDTALLVPGVEAEDWVLRVHGMVDRELTLDYRELLARPLVERDITLACVSNPVGGPYVGNARWVGAPLRDLLEEAGVHPGADQIVSRSVDGFTAGTPTAVATDGRDAMLAVAMNGEPLPLEHGFPVRMIVPGLYGYVSATKWLVELELTTFDAFDPYWIRRGWAERAPVKTMSRIDTPQEGSVLAPGPVAVAGVAWAQHRGIEGVEVRIDSGAWTRTELVPSPSPDTWRQWVFRWDATAGDHRIQVRATDGTGAVQSPAEAEPFPDGATGRHSILVSVG
jgi:DMSO/TMAO reductase YedYZ molybdopterin-dependent catalytic subunit